MSNSIMLSDKDFWSVVYGTSKHILGRSLTEQENRLKLKNLVEHHGAACSLNSLSKFGKYTRTLCKEHMDISATPTEQPERVFEVLRRMHREHPALFGKDEITAAKRLILAKRFVSKEHAELRRKVHRRKYNDYDEDEDEDYRPNHALTTMRCRWRSPPEAEAPSKRPQLSPTPREEDQDIFMRSPSRSVTQSPGKTHGSASSQAIPAFTSVQERDLTFLARPPIQVLRSVSNAGRRVVSDEVHQFLSTCQPPLVHLSNHLAEYGCTTEEHLIRLATWERKFRYERLKDMLKGATEMETLFLKKHLDTYFSPVGK